MFFTKMIELKIGNKHLSHLIIGDNVLALNIQITIKYLKKNMNEKENNLTYVSRIHFLKIICSYNNCFKRIHQNLYASSACNSLL